MKRLAMGGGRDVPLAVAKGRERGAGRCATGERPHERANGQSAASLLSDVPTTTKESFGAKRGEALPNVQTGNLATVVPDEVHKYSAVVPQMPAGRPGKVGLLRLRYEKREDITSIGDAYHQAPLRHSRPLYLDLARPDMVFSYIVSLGGGILQGDRLGVEVDVAPDAAVHLTTQSATKVYRMEYDYAVQQLRFSVGAGAYVEWIPAPLIPHRNSRLFQETTIDLHPEATFIFADMLLPGREGELFQFDVLYNRVNVVRDGRLIISDSMCLEPAARPMDGIGLMAEHAIMGTLYVFTPLMKAQHLVEKLRQVPLDVGGDVLFGCTTMPDDAGVVVRAVGASPRLVRTVLRQLWNESRIHLVGHPVPDRLFGSA